MKKPSHRPGIFISIDGPNGVGKTTLTNAVGLFLQRRGLRIHLTKEVTKTHLGDFIHKNNGKYFGKSLALLIAADREEHLVNDIFPALTKNDIVISDRYIDSSLVYQKIDGLALSYIWKLNENVLKPDISIVLMASPNTIFLRIKNRMHFDRFEMLAKHEEEIHLYKKAGKFLAKKGFNIYPFCNEKVSVEKAARLLSSAILDVQRLKLRPATFKI